MPSPAAELSQVARAAFTCTACPLYARATQTVFGEGPARARLVVVGEQPGDQEDRQGRPFVGPAGGVLDRALDRAGIERDRLYLTNAVKHFKWEPRGKRRIHQRPSGSEITACAPWLAEELEVVRPELLVLLGAVATQSAVGGQLKVTRDRGRVIPPTDVARAMRRRLGPDIELPAVLITLHPSAVLRADDPDEAFAGLVADLEVAAQWLASRSAGG